MPRSKRINVAGGVYHIITRGIERKEIFKDSADRREFLSRLGISLAKNNSKCFAWALMPNHIHLMIKTGAGSLSDVMRGLLTGYAIYFNKKYKRHGYLYQNRYKSILCQEDEYFQELVRYIHLNPVRAKIAKGIKELDGFLWCGHAAIIGRHKNKWQDTDEVLMYFGKKRYEAIRRYREFIEDGIGKAPVVDFSGGGLTRSAGGLLELISQRNRKKYYSYDEQILGGSEFVDKMLEEAEEKIGQRELLQGQGCNLEKIAERACGIFDISVSDLKKKGRANAVSKAKMLFCYWGHSEFGINGKQIGDYLGISIPAVCRNIAKGARLADKKYKLIS